MAAVAHTSAFRTRRFLNWFPMGLTYAFLYMGRYNLTVAKTSLGDLMTKEDFGIIFAAGTFCYAFAFLINGPLVDRLGGRLGILLASAGSAIANLVMAYYLHGLLADPTAGAESMVTTFSILYAVNMYFQSFGAVSIVKVNSNWFHVSERGGFSGIFGTMISSGIFLAFTVNGWLLKLATSHIGPKSQWIVFAAPSLLLGLMFFVEMGLLQNQPSGAGHKDFDTGDASSGDTSDEPIPTLELFKRILTNPVILTVALIEFCTGILRNGVMHWFPIYAKEVWVLPSNHALVYGQWTHAWLIGVMFCVAAVSGFLASKSAGRRRVVLVSLAVLAFLAPFVQGGWGGILFIAGVIGGNVAGWVSDLVFQSRRGPAAGGLYAALAVCTGLMIFTLAEPGNVVGDAPKGSGLVAGDEVLQIGGKKIEGWATASAAIKCWPAQCIDSKWDAKKCVCSTKSTVAGTDSPSQGTIPARINRDGREMDIKIADPMMKQKAGDKRKLKVRPVLPMSPFFLGAIVFLMSLCVIGTHGLLSGTATMDFGGRKGAGTAVGVIDGFVYLGTGVQSLSLGYLTSQSWSYWPLFLLPFAVIGFLLCLRIWNAKPGGSGAH
ncbi:MAG: MFS transporter [Myxococcales bacterium]|nr:MFS transporter [Myxococcales bacterium]